MESCSEVEQVEFCPQADQVDPHHRGYRSTQSTDGAVGALQKWYRSLSRGYCMVFPYLDVVQRESPV